MVGPDPVVDPLVAVLREAEIRGLVGPGQVEAGIEHAHAWADALAPTPEDAPARLLDLGSGGGLPGLVLAERWSDAEVVLLDARQRATEFLADAVATLALEGRVRILARRAEEAGRDPHWRETQDLVVARGFGPPAVTAECGSAFVRVGGRLSVSEPPERDPARWDAAGCIQLGLDAPIEVRVRDAHFVVLERFGPLDGRFPRRAGVPAKRPLW